MNAGMRMFRQLCQIRTATTIATSDKDLKSLTLFVNKIPWTVSKRELQQYFSQFGPVSKADVIFDERTGLSRGFGYVSFNYTKSYVKVLQTECHILEGKQLEIGQAKHSKKLENYEDEF